MTFHSVGNVMIPTDEVTIFQRGRLKPPTSFMMFPYFFLGHGKSFMERMGKYLGRYGKKVETAKFWLRTSQGNRRTGNYLGMGKIEIFTWLSVGNVQRPPQVEC